MYKNGLYGCHYRFRAIVLHTFGGKVVSYTSIYRLLAPLASPHVPFGPASGREHGDMQTFASVPPL